MENDGPSRFPAQDVQLLASGKVLHHEVGPGCEDGPENRSNGPESESIGTSYLRVEEQRPRYAWAGANSRI